MLGLDQTHAKNPKPSTLPCEVPGGKPGMEEPHQAKCALLLNVGYGTLEILKAFLRSIEKKVWNVTYKNDQCDQLI